MERLKKILEEQTDSIHEQILQVLVRRIKKGDELGKVRKWRRRSKSLNSRQFLAM